jgi:uncharacterized membrane protein
MHQSQMHYLPLAPGYFSALVVLFLVLLLLIQLGALRYAYMRLGVSSRTALILLFGSLIGSYFNIPIAQLPQEHVVMGREIDFFGMRYAVPYVVQWPGTVLAVNVGGAIIPTIMSTYLLFKYDLWGHAVIAVAVIAIACYALAEPIPGLGIAMPVLVPALVACIVALILSRIHAAQLAYIGGGLAPSSGRICLTSGKFPDSAHRWHRSVEQGHSTGYFWSVLSPSCSRA